MSGIEFTLDNNIATIHLNNELKKNVLDRDILKKISEFLKKIHNQNLNCLTITSSGNTFSAGMHFKELSLGDWSKNPISEVCDLIENLPFISICLINGGVYGGSVELAISCDFRVGSKNCKIQIPASKFGIHYGYKGIKRCIDFFGLQLTRKLLLLGDLLNYDDLIKTNFFDYFDLDFNLATKIFDEKINNMSYLSMDSIRKMKASINDYKNNNLDLGKENLRFISGFKNGSILSRIPKQKTK